MSKKEEIEINIKLQNIAISTSSTKEGVKVMKTVNFYAKDENNTVFKLSIVGAKANHPITWENSIFTDGLESRLLLELPEIKQTKILDFFPKKEPEPVDTSDMEDEDFDDEEKLDEEDEDIIKK